ncbi:MAG TPA: MFS transporter [Thermoplasmata archaeon]|nr:MFS transporter [Thermoplasmata archaeon]
MAHPGPAPPGGGAAAPFDPRKAREVLAVLAGAALMVTYVETMVVPAVVRFQVFFDEPPIATVAWILSAYLLVGVASTPIFAKLGDLYGKKRILLVVMSTYAVAVTLAGFTPDIGAAFGISRYNQIYLLIGVRALQGVGMAMFPLAFAMIGEVFPPNRVGVAQGIISAMFAGGATIGLVGGAWITQDFGWRTTYHTVIPFAILLVVLTAVVLTESRVRLAKRLDLPGATFLGLALATGLMGLSEGPYWGWADLSAVSLGGVPFGVPELFLVALVFSLAFLWWEPRIPNPVVDFARLKERNIWISNVVGLTAGAAMFLVFVANSFLIQVPVVGLGDSVLDSGLLSVPTSLTMMALAPVVGRSLARIGPKPIVIAGSLLMAAGGGLLALLTTSTFDVAGTAVPWIVLTTIPVLSGVIFCFIAVTNMIVLSSRPEEMGIQNGMNATFRTLGQSLGPVVATTILSTFTAPVLLGPGVAVTLPTLDAFRYVYATAALVGVASAVLALALRNYRYHADGTRHDDGVPATSPVPAAEPGAPA